MANIHARFRADDVAGALTVIIAQMKLAGWTDDGAPTKTILKSATDSEGRAAYILLRDSATPGGIAMDVGSGRSGDNITNHGGGGAPIVGAAAFFADRWFTLTISDRWVNYHAACDQNEYGWIFGGAFETPMDVATQRAVIFLIRSKTDALGNVVTQLDRYGSSGNYYATNNDDTGFSWVLNIHMFTPNSAGTKVTWTAGGGRVFGYTGGIGQVAYPWWFVTSDGFHVSGYVEGAILVSNLSFDDSRILDKEVHFNGFRYFLAGSESETIMGTEENFGLYLKGPVI